MKFKLLILLISISTSTIAETFTFLGQTLNVSGFVNHVYDSDSKIHIPNEGFNGAVNFTLTNEYGYISSQVSNNEHNHLRRLFLDVPLWSTNGFNSEMMLGRLNNPVGLINTIITNPYSNQIIMLPTSTYDPRRYENLPDIVDGLEIKLTKMVGKYTSKLYAWYGKQLLDQKDFNIYGSNFSFTGDSNYAYGFKYKIYDDDYSIQYTHTYTDGTIKHTNPPEYFNNVDKNTFQRLQFLSLSYKIENIKIQSETSYRELNSATNTIGTYLNVSYNFKDNWNVYTGYSYGTRLKETSTINDTVIGISNKIKNFDIGIEYHHINTNNWYFDYNQPIQNSYNVVLTSITYNF